uniref:Transmembrane protein 160 n=1 Tax=Geotrypetes seraphini TaxID=260995 RepID=A0A6P8S0W0_GEOSA|nr:transmembrane protein 160 [Geotrypetes seraphini]XP_033811406.1 transmembrane protein 160 [Geotrypetes seraphini]XP_033811407.1 transmembrane protein 160 [Geotrypetes seraphini]XP_033811408.1 transmembrane protein 160 [Geotrypetes seraphini]XP_033811409.1 transmembrane protein 160 [Geotrypetes seraphini]XP_033811410.1 transmembrane protein 160 [Geotrypetes seraphini]
MVLGNWWRAALRHTSGADLYFRWRRGYLHVGSGFWRGSSHGPVGPRGSNRPSSASSPITELDKADAWLLRKAHETGFLSWFRNGLLSTGIGVISYVQSDMGREAAYGFFILGGICVSYGSASYLASLIIMRRTMMLSLAVSVLNATAVLAVALFWLCAISLYIGRLEVEIVQDDEPEDESSDDDGGGGGSDSKSEN